jgi:hypothetical protein
MRAGNPIPSVGRKLHRGLRKLKYSGDLRDKRGACPTRLMNFCDDPPHNRLRSFRMRAISQVKALKCGPILLTRSGSTAMLSAIQ